MPRHWLALLLVCCAGASTWSADDWPRFRGPNGAGVATAASVPLRWTDADYIWKIKLPGVGHASPVVVGTRLFIASGEAESGKRFIQCLDTATGKALWQREFPSTSFQQHTDNSYATATPVADGQGVVFAWTTPEQVTLVALDNDGKDQWRRDLGPFVGIHGSGMSPIIVDDLVVYNNDQEDPAALPPRVYARPGAPKTAGKSCVLGLDRKTGATRWMLARASNQSSYATPCVRRNADGGSEIVAASTANGVYGIDAASGKLNWELKDTFKQRCVGSVVLAGDLVLASEGMGGTGVRAVAVQPGSAAKVVYEVLKPVAYVPTPLVYDGRVYLWGDDGKVTCVREKTGELLWREKVAGLYYASPICVNGRIYNISKTGDVVVLASGDKFEELARTPLGEKSFATPAVAGGVMYLRTFSQIFAIGATK